MEFFTIESLQGILTLLLLGGNGWTDLRKRKIWPWGSLGIALLGWAILLWNKINPLPYLGGMGIGGILIALGVLSQGGVGIGDGLVVVGLGCLLPWEEVLCTLLCGLGLSSILASILLLRKQSRKTQIPFLPFLFVGALLTLALRGWG